MVMIDNNSSSVENLRHQRKEQEEEADADNISDEDDVGDDDEEDEDDEEGSSNPHAENESLDEEDINGLDKGKRSNNHRLHFQRRTFKAYLLS